VAEIIRHERGHLNMHKVFRLLYNTPADTDRDRIPDADEPDYLDIATDPADPDTYLTAQTLNHPPYATYGDEEIRCRLLETKEDFVHSYEIRPEKDWAAPGCQHVNQWGPKVNR